MWNIARTRWSVFFFFFDLCPGCFSKLSDKTQNKQNTVCPIFIFFLNQLLIEESCWLVPAAACGSILRFRSSPAGSLMIRGGCFRFFGKLCADKKKKHQKNLPLLLGPASADKRMFILHPFFSFGNSPCVQVINISQSESWEVLPLKTQVKPIASGTLNFKFSKNKKLN